MQIREAGVVAERIGLLGCLDRFRVDGCFKKRFPKFRGQKFRGRSLTDR
jgi:hypothetical protein